MQHFDTIIIGGGAAGFFTAINLAQKCPSLSILILEKSKEVLSKVKISGGGRCNVTHAEFIPKELIGNYPRGERELLGPFHTFMTGDTVAWFEERGIPLKIEQDGRMFPETDSSLTIIDCFLNEAKRLGVSIYKQQLVQSVKRQLMEKESYWVVQTNSNMYPAKWVVVATGSSPKVWSLLKDLGHSIIDPVPSLFTFNIKDERIEGLMGLSTMASVTVLDTNLCSEGPLLITHWGMSGPSILKLSAWGARAFNELAYRFRISVNWLLDQNFEDTLATLKELRQAHPKQSPYVYAQFDLPKRLWQSLLAASGIFVQDNWADISNKYLNSLAGELTKGIFTVNGKSTFKEEFVTAGGVDLKEIDFKTFESKLHNNLFLAGEVLNIDAITGGFNFQNAWTGGYIAAMAIANREK